VEARSPTGDVFGKERLRATLEAHAGSAKGLVQGAVDTVHAFTRQAEPHDDLTLLAASRTG
jgi:serine phosphatase RsbU (regulator of sigma subunit)